MKLRFLGVGSAFTSLDYFQSNILMESRSGKHLLIDCGSDIRFSLPAAFPPGTNCLNEINAIYISHLHADHIGGLEWVAFSTYFNPTIPRPGLYSESTMMRKLWEHSLQGGLSCINGKSMTLSDFFDCKRCTEGVPFLWEELIITPVKVPHVEAGYDEHPSYGLLITEEGKPGQVFITTDIRFCPELIEEIAPQVQTIFHDCETSPFATGVHAHYNDLNTLSPNTKAKLWLYHYQPTPTQDAEKDGFQGFVKKGQVFQYFEPEQRISESE